MNDDKVKKKMQIVIVGVGYVGLTAGICFASMNYDVVCVDIDCNKISRLQNGECTIFEVGMQEMLNEVLEKNKISFTTDYENAYKDADLIFICVPTPESENGDVDLKYVNQVLKDIIPNMKKEAHIVLKSTVPVGTSDEIQKKYGINIIFNPEFLCQGEAIHNFMEPQRIVIGVSDEVSRKIMEDLYSEFDCPKLFMSLKAAEISKYACNNFLAVKLTYINEMADLCDRLEINIEDVLSVMKLDNRIGSLYMEPGIGYGGSCLPKDTKAFSKLAAQNDVELDLVNAAIKSNKRHRNKLLEKLDKYHPQKDKLNVAVLGLSFKSNTNDLRESQAVETIFNLCGNVNKIMAFDNKLDTLEKCKKIFREKDNVSFSNDINKTLKNSDVCMIFNREKEILELSPKKFCELMKTPMILDGKNCFDIPKMNYENIEYNSIGRNKK